MPNQSLLDTSSHLLFVLFITEVDIKTGNFEKRKDKDDDNKQVSPVHSCLFVLGWNEASLTAIRILCVRVQQLLCYTSML